MWPHNSSLIANRPAAQSSSMIEGLAWRSTLSWLKPLGIGISWLHCKLMAKGPHSDS
ncbi:hypothetical protein BS78_02G170900 [Paspalum vaginatum]|nr:hypothetical protein BS78_02G170900 [Paspalum vaginatum]